MQGKRVSVTAAACALLLFISGHAATATLHPSAPRQSELAPSPEEAVVALKPLQLAASELPQGYRPGATTVDTPASEAVSLAARGADPYATLSQRTSEGTQACSVQRVSPPAGAPMSNAALRICLMSDPLSASKVVQNEARAIDPGTATLTSESVPGERVLGDGVATAWRLSGTDANGGPATDFDLRWSRGLLAFELVTHAAPGQAEASASIALSQTIDQSEAARAAVVLPASTVPAPVTETHRVFDVLNAQTALHAASLLPSPGEALE